MIEESTPKSHFDTQSETLTIERGTPERFTLRWKILGNIAGILVGVLPIFVILAFCVVACFLVHPILGIFSAFVLLVVYLFLHLFVTSPYFQYYLARRIVEANHPQAIQDPQHFMVQIAFSPRVCGGIQELLDDADDIGVLFVREDHLAFTGDSMNLRIPYSSIHSMMLDLPSPFRLFIGGRRIDLRFRPAQEFKEITIDNRGGKTVFEDIKGTRRLVALLQRSLEDWCIRANVPEEQRPQLPRTHYHEE